MFRINRCIMNIKNFPSYSFITRCFPHLSSALVFSSLLSLGKENSRGVRF